MEEIVRKSWGIWKEGQCIFHFLIGSAQPDTQASCLLFVYSQHCPFFLKKKENIQNRLWIRRFNLSHWSFLAVCCSPSIHYWQQSQPGWPHPPFYHSCLGWNWKAPPEFIQTSFNWYKRNSIYWAPYPKGSTLILKKDHSNYTIYSISFNIHTEPVGAQEFIKQQSLHLNLVLMRLLASD